MGKLSYFYLSIGQKPYFYIFYITQEKRKAKYIYMLYSRRNRATIVFYMLLVYLYRDKIKRALYALSVRYIELCIIKENSPAIISRGRKEREGNFTPSKAPKPYQEGHCL